MADAAAASCLVQVAHMQATNQADTSLARGRWGVGTWTKVDIECALGVGLAVAFDGRRSSGLSGPLADAGN